jgi:predicted RNA-binding protein with PUA-like domain
MKRFWLLKSEPGCYSIQDLERDGQTFWDGIRNYQARNMLRDDIQAEDLCLFYHSNASPSAVAGLCRVVNAGSPDMTQFDPTSEHPDPESDPKNPRWYGIDIAFQEKFAVEISLEQLRQHPGLSRMELLKKGSRLSVMPVRKEEFEIVCGMGRR